MGYQTSNSYVNFTHDLWFGSISFSINWKIIKNRLEYEISLSTIAKHISGNKKHVKLEEATVQLIRDA